jgi:uncharacterized protein involved in exopolysaccharide biosynthesis
MRLHLLFFIAALAWPALVSAQTYSATAQIKIESPGIETLGAGAPPMDAQVQNEVEVLESPDVLSPVITEQKLDAIWAKRFGANSGPLGMEEALNHLHLHLRIVQVEHTSVIAITVTSEIGQEAAEIANGIADRYKKMRDDAEKQLADSGIRVLEDQIAQEKKVIADAGANAAKNPEDASLLQALNQKLDQDKADEKKPHSPVLILTRAVPKPE